MKINDLENIAKREKLNIVNYKMKPKARILEDYIFMDYSQIHTDTEEKCILAEELGHYYYDSYYTLSSSQSDIDKAEYKATKWAFKTLVPFSKIKELANKGYKYYYEYAEELGITEGLVEKAYKYYMNNQ